MLLLLCAKNRLTLIPDWERRQKWLERWRRRRRLGRLQLGWDRRQRRRQVQVEREASLRSLFHPRLRFREKSSRKSLCYKLPLNDVITHLNVFKFSKHCTWQNCSVSEDSTALNRSSLSISHKAFLTLKISDLSDVSTLKPPKVVYTTPPIQNTWQSLKWLLLV